MSKKGSTQKVVTPADLAAWEPHLGTLFPRVPMLRPDQIAGPLGVDLRTVARLFEVDDRPDAYRPWLKGIEFSAGDTGERKTRRFPRDNVILFWAHSANYSRRT